MSDAMTSLGGTGGRLVKICGITRLGDALHAARQGATALGFVFWPASPRAIGVGEAGEIAAALPAGVAKVGVFVDESADRVSAIVRAVGLDLVQLHGRETAPEFAGIGCRVLRAVTLENAAERAREWPGGTTLLLDAHDPVRRGGTGRPVDWDRAAVIASRHAIVLAGGLTPRNVEQAIERVRPIGVDVSSGVESAPGVKDLEKVSAFLMGARRAFEQVLKP